MQFAFPGWLRESTSQCCAQTWEPNPCCVPHLSTPTAADHSSVPNTQSKSLPIPLFPHHTYSSQRSFQHTTQRHSWLQRAFTHLPEGYDTGYKILLLLSFCNSFTETYPHMCFSSEHQACKLLFQAKKSLKEVTPQRTGSAQYLRGSHYVEYPWETKCSHIVSRLFWHQSCSLG